MPDLINIYIMENRYQVPASLTIMKALEYAGYRLIRGAACRGGFCGACATVYRVQGDYRLHYALACQTMVQEGMCLTMLPFFPATKATYDIEKIQPTAKEILRLYPETLKCLGCNTCTKSCPQEIDVLACISEAMRGNIAEVANKSFNCIMCGLCSARCPADIVPYDIALLSRRLYGRHVAPKARHLEARVKEVAAGAFDKELARLKRVSPDKLHIRYRKRELEP